MDKSKQVIASIQLGDEQIVFHFIEFWYQEDIGSLSVKVLAYLSQVRILETIQGADRENIRFTWQMKYYFSLNFDCYSQSCWLEGEDEESNKQLKHLITDFNVVKGC